MGSNEGKCLLFEKPFLIGSYYTQMIIEGCNGKEKRYVLKLHTDVFNL